MEKSTLERLMAAQSAHGECADAVVSDWIDASCDVDITTGSTTDEMYRAYCWWHRAKGAQVLLSERAMTRAMTALGVQRIVSDRGRLWRGLVVRPECTPPADWADDGMRQQPRAWAAGSASLDPEVLAGKIREWAESTRSAEINGDDDLWSRSRDLYRAYTTDTGHRPGVSAFGQALGEIAGLVSDRVEVIDAGRRHYVSVWRGIVLSASWKRICSEGRGEARVAGQAAAAPKPSAVLAAVAAAEPAPPPPTKVKPWMIPAVPDAEHNAWRAEQLRLHEQRRQRDYAAAVAAAQQREHPDDI